jgi:hypothetical protein
MDNRMEHASAWAASLADNYIYFNDKVDWERVNLDCEVMEELAHEVT